MSHRATNWLASVPPTEMTAGEFRVMFHLCDCHNPALGCFPSQVYLLEKTGLSNGGLNKCLASLEGKKILRRERRYHDGGGRKSTRYILGFELDEAQGITPLSGDTITPLSGGHNSTGVELSIIEGTSNRTSKNTSCDFAQFWEVYPHRGGVKRNRKGAIQKYEKAIRSGVDPQTILIAAQALHDDEQVKRGYARDPVTWLNQEGWTDEVHQKPADAELDQKRQRWRRIAGIDAQSARH